MLSPRAIYGEIFSNDEAFRLFCSIAASGEAQGGWENGRIAALTPDSLRDLAPRISRHGADEDKHGRIFRALLRKRNLSLAPVPAGTDYAMRLERMGIGLAHSKLRANRPLTEADIIAYLAHSRVTEQRASEQMRSLYRYSTGNADVRRAVTMISADEDNHLAYCHEELLRLAATGHRRDIDALLRATARAEVTVYRDVSKAVMAHLAQTLGWSPVKRVIVARESTRFTATSGSAAGAAWSRCGCLPAVTRSDRPLSMAVVRRFRFLGAIQHPDQSMSTGGRSSTCCLVIVSWMPSSTGDGADRDGDLLAAPQVALLEQHVGHVAAAAGR